MTRICNSIQIRQPIEQVFDFITTPANWPQWHPASVSVGGNADHSLLPGEVVTENISVAGHHGQVTWLVRERSAPHRWVIDGTGKDGGRATITYTLTPHPAGTKFRARACLCDAERVASGLGLVDYPFAHEGGLR